MKQALKLPGVYQILCVETNRAYIGETSNFKRRWKEHRQLLRLGRHSNKHLQEEWNLFGEAAFSFSIVKVVETPKERKLFEVHSIRQILGSGCYNQSEYSPPAGSRRGAKLSEETKAKIGLANRGRKHSEEAKAQISSSSLGRKLSEEALKKARLRVQSEETKAKIRAANLGRKQSEESKRKISEAKTGKKLSPLSEEHKAKIASSHIGVKLSEGHRARISAVRKGVKLSEEHKARISASVKATKGRAKASLCQEDPR